MVLWLTYIWWLVAYPVHQVFSTRAMEWLPACMVREEVYNQITLIFSNVYTTPTCVHLKQETAHKSEVNEEKISVTA